MKLLFLGIVMLAVLIGSQKAKAASAGATVGTQSVAAAASHR
ncbi:MAG TPA: hypothetical protein VH420_05715 [Gaiellaceae bacterium]|jgi:hypothetical protein